MKTPGREDEEVKQEQTAMSSLPSKVLHAMGGQSNIAHLDACITRLRVEVNNKNMVNVDTLKSLGASGVLTVGNNIQAIFGPMSDQLKHDMTRIIKGEVVDTADSNYNEEQQVKPSTLAKGQTIQISAPFKGQPIPLEDVPDKVFATKMMGDGIGFIPQSNVVTAPFNGKVKTVFPTKHALGLESDEGLELLIHIGIDTVKLNGQGFETLVEADQIIEQGQPLVKLDLEYIEQHAPSIITPLIFTNLKQQDVELVTTDKVNEGDLIINIKIKD